MTTAAELRASQSNPRIGDQAFAADLDGEIVVVTEAHYRPSLFGKGSNSGGFDEYLVLNFYFASDRRKRPRWLQTQAVDLFRMFRGLPAARFPVTGTFTVGENDAGQPTYSLV